MAALLLDKVADVDVLPLRTRSRRRTLERLYELGSVRRLARAGSSADPSTSALTSTNGAGLHGETYPVMRMLGHCRSVMASCSSVSMVRES